MSSISDYPAIQKILILMYMIKNGIKDSSKKITNVDTVVESYYNALTQDQSTEIDAILSATLCKLNLTIFYKNNTTDRIPSSPAHVVGSGAWSIIYDKYNITGKGANTVIMSYQYMYDDLGLMEFISKELSNSNINYYGTPISTGLSPYKFSIFEYLYILGSSLSAGNNFNQDNFLPKLSPSVGNVIQTLIDKMHQGIKLI